MFSNPEMVKRFNEAGYIVLPDETIVAISQFVRLQSVQTWENRKPDGEETEQRLSFRIAFRGNIYCVREVVVNGHWVNQQSIPMGADNGVEDGLGPSPDFLVGGVFIASSPEDAGKMSDLADEYANLCQQLLAMPRL